MITTPKFDALMHAARQQLGAIKLRSMRTEFGIGRMLLTAEFVSHETRDEALAKAGVDAARVELWERRGALEPTSYFLRAESVPAR